MPRLIVILGHTRAGKDTVADIICDITGSRKVAFGDAPKRYCSEIFGVPLEAFYDERKDEPLRDFPAVQCPRCRSMRVAVPGRYWRFWWLGDYLRCASCGLRSARHHFRRYWTPRMMVQHVATEGCRFIDPRVWAKFGVRTALETATAAGSDVAVVSDGRFISEAEETVAAGGEVWRLRSIREQAGNGIGGHQSQLEVDRVSPRLVARELRNDGTIEDLRVLVSSLLR